ncbi:MAG: cation:proton antiporter [Candidatus Eremiobacteraeota bacterium]|nr:cation:proton antiporter [Candidatus Eremiobacteraeota bacterium]
MLLLIALGAGVESAEPGRFAYAFGAATLYVFLPPLLFEAAWNLDADELLRRWRPIVTLAVPGVAITTLIVGAAMWLVHVPLPAAVLVGAIVSATDPIAIVAIFRRMPVPAALSTIVQSEALLNDAVVVVAYRAILAALLAGFSARGELGIAFVACAQVAAGIALGIGAAYLVALALRRQDRDAPQMIGTLAGAFVTYLGADFVHCSGIFATIAFGIALRAYERRFIELSIARDVERFWDVLALAANACVFFLTGAALDISHAFSRPLAAVAALFGIAVARLVLAYALTPLAMGTEAKPAWLHVIRVAGARGALSLALAIALPATLAFRDLAIDVTFAVVLATLLASALVVPRTIRRLAGQFD